MHPAGLAQHPPYAGRRHRNDIGVDQHMVEGDGAAPEGGSFSTVRAGLFFGCYIEAGGLRCFSSQGHSLDALAGGIGRDRELEVGAIGQLAAMRKIGVEKRCRRTACGVYRDIVLAGGGYGLHATSFVPGLWDAKPHTCPAFVEYGTVWEMQSGVAAVGAPARCE